MATQAMQALTLDRVVFMVNSIPPHKQLAFNTPVEQRLDMLRLAIAGYENFCIDDQEARLDQPSYSYISMRRIRQMISSDTTLYFIIGADSLMMLDQWRKPDEMMTHCAFAVIPREGYTKAQCMQQIQRLKVQYNADITYVDGPQHDVSSTDIRDGRIDPTNLNPQVAAYIRQHHLYEETE